MPFPLNSLHVTALMDPAMGGPPQGIRASITALKSRRVTGAVVCCDAPDATWLGKDPFAVHALGPSVPKIVYTHKLSPWLDKNLNRFDAVVVHGIWVWPSICAARAVARERKRRLAEGGSGKPLRFFVMCHGMLDPWFQRDKSRRVKAVRNWFYWWLIERGVVNSADAVLFTCQQELELARTTFGGYRPKREINVGYGIAEPPAFEPKMQEAFAERCPGVNGRPYLLFMSRIHAKKNVAALVRAYARVRSEVLRGLKDQETKRPKDLEFPDLVVAGPGWDSDYGREVRALIDETNKALRAETEGLRAEVGSASAQSDYGVTRDRTADGVDAAATKSEHRTLNTEHSAPIHAVAMLSGDAKWGALYGCEAFVLPSHQENFGIAVVEALACGKPVLISDQVNIWREIADADAGFVEADTEDGAVRLLKRFMAREDAPEMAERARECYLSRFAIGPAASNFAQVLKHGAINPG